MSELKNTTPRRSGFARFLLGLLRVLLVLAVGILIGAAGFFGVRYLLDEATAPAEANARRLASIETQQADVRGQLNDRMADFSERLADLEASADVTVNDIDELRANEDALADVVSQLDQNLGGLAKLESELEIELSALRSTVAVMNTQDAIALLTPTATPDVGAADDLKALTREVKMLKSLELLSRSRLHFLNADYGLAEKDLQNAYRVLVDLQVAGLAPEGEMYDEMLERLKEAGSQLPDSPNLAQSDMEIAWDLLVEILTNPVIEEKTEADEEATATTTPLSSSTALSPSFVTNTSFPTHTLTPERETKTPTPTPTPWVTPTPSE